MYFPKFIGKRNFNICQNILDDELCVELYAKNICSSDLEKGTEIILGWAPNRIVLLRYDGQSTYTVMKFGKLRKLLVGDQFQAESFVAILSIFPKSLGTATTHHPTWPDREGLDRVDVVTEETEE